MHRSSILLLALSLGLAACDKKSDSTAELKGSSGNGRTPREGREHREVPDYKRRAKTPPSGSAERSPEEINSLREQAADLANTNPAGLVAWAEKNFPGEDPALESIYQVFVNELLKKDSAAAISLAATIPAGSHARDYASALYRGIATIDPAKAWALLKEGTLPITTLAAIRSISSAEVDARGLEAALASYRANRSDTTITPFFAFLTTEKGFSRADVSLALREVQALEGETGYSGALSGVVRNTPPAQRDVVTSFLADKPKEPKYNLAYAATATLILETGDPLTAATWAARITDPGVKAAAVKSIRDRLATVDAGTRAKTEELLK
ncbi:hypothetical protein [Luteolibacter sp. LG18]|uniref:hypothetical protein n=1 Tax=Luteolibacter sp. LG18 TaxID=2819286 RepID=UPI002B2ED92F|nr:hypothetical protein llg_27020 [Luteolibacter sp. LG18]